MYARGCLGVGNHDNVLVLPKLRCVLYLPTLPQFLRSHWQHPFGDRTIIFQADDYSLCKAHIVVYMCVFYPPENNLLYIAIYIHKHVYTYIHIYVQLYIIMLKNVLNLGIKIVWLYIKIKIFLQSNFIFCGSRQITYIKNFLNLNILFKEISNNRCSTRNCLSSLLAQYWYQYRDSTAPEVNSWYKM